MTIETMRTHPTRALLRMAERTVDEFTSVPREHPFHDAAVLLKETGWPKVFSEDPAMIQRLVDDYRKKWPL